MKVNSVKAWVLAARPKTLVGAAVPVMIGTALALADNGGKILLLPCVLCFLFALLMQIDANFVNDYFDFMRGNDDASTRLGPLRACSMGWITPYAMRWGLLVTTTLSCFVGLPLVLFGGIDMILVGALCVLFCFLYTTRLSYLGLGDILVLVFFGLVPVCLTYYLCLPIESHRMTWQVVVYSLACGFSVEALLLVNNYRDIYNDERDGKITLVVRAGHHGGQLMYLFTGVIALALVAVAGLCRGLWAVLVPVLVYTPLHVLAYRRLVAIDRGRQLNEVLGMTARNMVLFGLSVSAGILLSAWL